MRPTGWRGARPRSDGTRSDHSRDTDRRAVRPPRCRPRLPPASRTASCGRAGRRSCIAGPRRTRIRSGWSPMAGSSPSWLVAPSTDPRCRRASWPRSAHSSSKLNAVLVGVPKINTDDRYKLGLRVKDVGRRVLVITFPIECGLICSPCSTRSTRCSRRQASCASGAC